MAKEKISEKFLEGQIALRKWTETWKDNDKIMSELRTFIETVGDIVVELDNCEPINSEVVDKVYQLLVLIEKW